MLSELEVRQIFKAQLENYLDYMVELNETDAEYNATCGILMKVLNAKFPQKFSRPFKNPKFNLNKHMLRQKAIVKWLIRDNQKVIQKLKSPGKECKTCKESDECWVTNTK